MCPIVNKCPQHQCWWCLHMFTYSRPTRITPCTPHPPIRHPRHLKHPIPPLLINSTYPWHPRQLHSRWLKFGWWAASSVHISGLWAVTHISYKNIVSKAVVKTPATTFVMVHHHSLLMPSYRPLVQWTTTKTPHSAWKSAMTSKWNKNPMNMWVWCSNYKLDQWQTETKWQMMTWGQWVGPSDNNRGPLLWHDDDDTQANKANHRLHTDQQETAFMLKNMKLPLYWTTQNCLCVEQHEGVQTRWCLSCLSPSCWTTWRWWHLLGWTQQWRVKPHLYIPLSCINTGILPNSLYTCIWAKPDQPKKLSIAMVPGLIRICNRVF